VHAQHAVGQDRHVVAEALDHLHDVAGEDHGAAAGDEALQDVADQGGRHGVDGLERLVEHEQARRVQQGAGQAHLLLHAGRVVDHQGAVADAQLENLEQLAGPLVDGGGVHPAEQAVIGEQLGTREPVEQAHAVRQDADPGLGRRRVGPDVVAQQERLAGVGAQQADGHGQGGRLAGAVGTEQAVERAGRNVEAHVGDGELGVEVLDQTAQRHGGRILLARALRRHRHEQDVSRRISLGPALIRAVTRVHAA
jgi:hypothetical protein